MEVCRFGVSKSMGNTYLFDIVENKKWSISHNDAMDLKDHLNTLFPSHEEEKEKDPEIMKGRIPVLVTTDKNGVFFGYAKEDKAKKDGSIKLKRARNIYYWPIPESNDKGVFALATIGPGKGAKVGPPVTQRLYKVLSVTIITDEAKEAWEGAIWE